MTRGMSMSWLPRDAVALAKAIEKVLLHSDPVAYSRCNVIRDDIARSWPVIAKTTLLLYKSVQENAL